MGSLKQLVHRSFVHSWPCSFSMLAWSGKEIIESGVVGAWEHKGIEDSQVWLDELRLREEEKRK